MPVHEPAGSYWRTLPNGHPALFSAEGKVLHVSPNKAGDSNTSAVEKIDRFLRKSAGDAISSARKAIARFLGDAENEKWITTEQGSHVLLGPGGEIKGGLGGKFTGQNISSLPKSAKPATSKTSNKQNQQQAKPATSKTSNKQNQQQAKPAKPEPISGTSGNFVQGKDISSQYKESQLTSDFNLAKNIIEKQGFDGKPTVMSKEELTKYIQENGTMELFRGYGSDDSGTLSSYSDGFKTGDMYISGDKDSLYGAGIYTTNTKRTANNYASGMDGKSFNHSRIDRMTLRKDAKILSVNAFGGEPAEVDGYDHGFSPSSSLGNYAAAKGYDAIQVERGPEKYLVIVNRTAVITDGDNHYEG